MSDTVVAQGDGVALLCRSGKLEYVPDFVRHKYGESDRRPLEDLFLDELRFFEERHPSHDIFTLGSSLVFGERFIFYLTTCQFELNDEDEFPLLQKALHSSDQAIRRKFWPMWKWDLAGRSGRDIVLVVGWLDFVYFLQHRSDFLDKRHGRYMHSFLSDQDSIQSSDYKVLHDGVIVPFDESQLDDADTEIMRHHQDVEYYRTAAETML